MQREVAAPPAAATPTATARPSGGKNNGNSEDIAQLQKENADLAASPNHAKVDKQAPANDLPKSPGGGGGGGASAEGGGGGLHEQRTDTPPRLSSLVVIRNIMCSVGAAIRNDAAEFFAYARRAALALQPSPAQSRMLIAVLLFYIAYRELLRLRRRR